MLSINSTSKIGVLGTAGEFSSHARIYRKFHVDRRNYTVQYVASDSDSDVPGYYCDSLIGDSLWRINYSYLGMPTQPRIPPGSLNRVLASAG